MGIEDFLQHDLNRWNFLSLQGFLTAVDLNFKRSIQQLSLIKEKHGMGGDTAASGFHWIGVGV